MLHSPFLFLYLGNNFSQQWFKEITHLMTIINWVEV